MTWYEILLIIAAALFVFSVISSIFFGEIDIDADIEGGTLLSDVVSFKGLLHFILGFSLTLTLFKGISFASVIIGIITGLVFVFVLYYIYKLLHEKLQQNIQYTDEITDAEAEVYYWSKEKQFGEVFITLEGRPVQIILKAKGDASFENGQRIRVSGNRKVVYPVNS